MNDLQVRVIEFKPAVVQFNYEEMSAYAKQLKTEYENLVFTEETVKEGKKVVAELRKIQKSINDFKVGKKKELTESVSLFESQCKDIISEFDDPINFISEQLETFEANRIATRTELINSIIQTKYTEIGLDERFRTIEIQKAWLNATTKEKEIEKEVSAQIEICIANQNTYYSNVELIMTNVELANSQFSLGVKLDSEIFIKQLDFKSIDQIKQDIVSYAEKQKFNEQEFARKKEQEANLKAAETVSKAIESVQEFIPESKTQSPLLNTSFRIRGTREQFDALKRYMLASGIEILEG